MRTAVFLLAALTVVAAAAATPPKTYVRENFSGTQFPPPGWSTAGSSEGQWSWKKSNDAAVGYVSVQFGQKVHGSLYTPSFQIGNATRLRLQFRYYTDGFLEIERYVRIRNWYARPGYYQQWRTYSVYTPTFPHAGPCRAEFRIYGSDGTHGFDGVWVVDDVVITLDTTGVEATSLGRVRALCR